MKLQLISLALTVALTLTGCGTAAPAPAQSGEEGQAGIPLVLSDERVTLDGQTVTEDRDGAVTISHDIVYCQAGKGADYGEGTQEEEHTAQEAQAHTVVTIRQPGTYLVSGSLSAGQLAIDLGEDAKRDPEAVVTLILNGVDITCTVAPALIFYNVYECDTAWVAYEEEETEEYASSSTVDTAAAGANIILADGSENTFTGSHVARIYKEGSTKKLHKYDGAFYSKMSINIFGQSDGTGRLNIIGDNEGLDSELHLTIHGGVISIMSQDDGINTNEDGVSVTTINGGTVQINAGLGAEGDGIDSNGHLVINGGNVYTMSNDRSPDGGIDADGDILLNGGYVVALGTRNDAVSDNSQQPFMELSFASTLPAGSRIELSDAQGDVLLSFTTEKTCQSLTFTSPDLKQDVDYTLKVDGVVQQYTGNFAGGFGGHGGGPRPDPQSPFEGEPPESPPEGNEPLQHFGASQDRPEGGRPLEDGQQPQEPPQNGLDGQRPPRRDGQQGEQSRETPSTAFTITGGVHSFSGIADSAQDSGKTQVTFSAEVAVDETGRVTVSNIQASAGVDAAHVQITITDVPSEDYSASCLLSDGEQVLADILPADPGIYEMTISVAGDNSYTGASQFRFTVK